MHKIPFLFFLLFFSVCAQTNDEKVQPNNMEEAIDASRYEPGEELIFTLLLDKYILGEYFVLVTEDGFAIDFDSLITVLDFPIVRTSNRVFEGWFISREKTFFIDFNNINESGALLRLKNEELRIPKHQITEYGNEIYISLNAVKKMFPISFNFNNSKLQANLLAFEPLPLQKKLARENTKIGSGSKRNREAQFPRLNRSYELLSPQSIDLQLNTTYSESRGNTTDGYSLLGGREIAYLNSRFFLSGNSEDYLQAGRLTLSKNFESGLLPNYLDIKSVEFGDVNPVQIGTQTFRGDTLGIIATNDIGNRELNDQQSITISGEVQNGWDVELYRNGIIIDRRLEVSTGQYDFADVKLYLGENKFKVVLYGPQGQEITREIERYVDESALADNRLRYRSSFTKLDSSLFNTRSSQSFTQDVFDWSTQIQKGITRGTSLSLGWRLQSSDEGSNELVVGVNTAITDRVRLNLNYSQDFQKTEVLTAALRTRLSGHDINLSASTSDIEGIKRDTIGVDNRGLISVGAIAQIDYFNEVLYSEFAGRKQISASNDLGIPMPIGLISHKVQYTRNETRAQLSGLPAIEEITLGGFNFRARIAGVIARAGLNYSLEDNLEVNSYSLDLSWKPRDLIRTRLSLAYSPQVDELFSRLDIGYESQNFNVSANIRHSDSLGFSSGISARFSLGGEPFTQDVFYTRRALVNSGTLVVRVFEDMNANAVYDIGEKVIEGVEVRSLQSLSKAETDNDGLAILQGLSTNKQTDIVIDTETIDEPFLMPIIEGVSIMPRQNFIDSIDYPLVYLNEIEGQLTFSDNADALDKLPSITIELKNSENKVIATTKTEYDGYFYLADIPPGAYVLGPSNSELDQNNYRFIKPVNIEFSGKSKFITANSFNLTKIDVYSGYSVRIASMNSVKMLKAMYESMLVRDILGLREQSAFYTKRDGKYDLNIGFFREQSNANSLCTLYKKVQLPCRVFQHTQQEKQLVVR
jgi:hypothetical protein